MTLYKAVMRGGPANGKLYVIEHTEIFFAQFGRDDYAKYVARFPANTHDIHDAEYVGQISKLEYEMRRHR